MFKFLVYRPVTIISVFTFLFLFIFNSAPDELVQLHIKLLRKRRKYIQRDKWERALAKFISEYSNVDAWELERYGYKNVNLGIRLTAFKVNNQISFFYFCFTITMTNCNTNCLFLVFFCRISLRLNSITMPNLKPVSMLWKLKHSVCLP